MHCAHLKERIDGKVQKIEPIVGLLMEAWICELTIPTCDDSFQHRSLHAYGSTKVDWPPFLITVEVGIKCPALEQRHHLNWSVTWVCK